MLNANEQQEIDDDISNWTCEMQSREKDLDEGKAILTNEPCLQPEIRQIKTNTTKVYRYNNQSTGIYILLRHCLKRLLL